MSAALGIIGDTTVLGASLMADLSVRWQFEVRISEAQFLSDDGLTDTTQVAISPPEIYVTVFAEYDVPLDCIEGVTESDFRVVRKQERSFTLAT